MDNAMAKPVSPELILRQSEELQRLRVSQDRASELAGEVERLNSTVCEAALELEFDDEPAAFPRLLRMARSREPTDG